MSAKCAYSAYVCIAQRLKNQGSKFTMRRLYFNGQTSLQSEVMYAVLDLSNFSCGSD